MPEQPTNSNKVAEASSNGGSSELSQQQQQQAPQAEPTVVREITQTDQLNKRLLSSLLEHMNNGDEYVKKFLESSSSDDQEQESEF